MPVAINLSLCLPRDGFTVPVVRHICGRSMREIGVLDECATAVELALTEACTNVLDHSTADNPYEVHVGINDEVCSIRVKDVGTGFDVDEVTPPHGLRAIVDSESGRGIGMMQALVDDVQFVAVPDDGMIVHLQKNLEFDEEHPLRRAGRAEPADVN